MIPEPGTLAFSDIEGLVLAIGGKRYLIALDDVRSLMIFGRVVPIVRESLRTGTRTADEYVVTIEGYAAVSRSGESLRVFIRKGSYIVPLASVQRVVRGEADSAPLFPFLPDWPDEMP
jgi:hypothetical protein